MNWVARLFAQRAEPEPKSVAAQPASAAISAPPPIERVSALPYLPWISGIPMLKDVALSADEQRILDELAKVLKLPIIPENMLPRAAELLPQLIGLLRETQLPLQAVAERVNKDGVLAAEVMRLASSPFYRVQGDVGDTVQAIRLIGSVGLQTVIARVVLKPIYRSSAGLMNANLAARLWKHSEALAHHASVLAAAAGQEAFDGYLAGMLHSIGWKIALCAMERAGISPNAHPSNAFVAAVLEQVHRLFGHAAQRWTITPGFMAFAQDARQHGLAGGRHALAPVLRQAQLLCGIEDGLPR